MRVAIVDDNAGIRRLLAEVLTERAGVVVVGYAPDGDEVLEMVRAHDPELVIMDYSMPRVNGVRASAALHAERPAVEIVAFTSTSDQAIVDAFLMSGARTHFDKTRIDELVDYVASRASVSDATAED